MGVEVRRCLVDGATVALKLPACKKYFANFRKSLSSRAFRAEVFFGEYAANHAFRTEVFFGGYAVRQS